MSLRSGIINDYSVPMGTSTFARPTRDLNWTIYWFIQVLAVHLTPFIPVQAALITIQSCLSVMPSTSTYREKAKVYISHFKVTVHMFNCYSH